MSMSWSDSTSTNVQLVVEPNIVNDCQSASLNPVLSSELCCHGPVFSLSSDGVTSSPSSVLDSVKAVDDTSKLHSSASSSEFSDVTSQSHVLPPDGLEADDLGSLLEQFEEAEVIMAKTSEEPCSDADIKCYAKLDDSSSFDLQQDIRPSRTFEIRTDDPLTDRCYAMNVIQLPLHVSNSISVMDTCISATRRSKSTSDLSFVETHDRRSHRFSSNYKKFTKVRKHRIESIENSSVQAQLFDKLPNYYTALSIPARALAGSMAHSSADLVAEFIEHRDRNQLPEREDVHLLDKIPAYQTSFTNSTRYDEDNMMCRDLYEEDFNTVDYSQEEFEKDIKSNWSTISSSDSENSAINEDFTELERNKIQHVERRIVYVGRLPQSFTSSELRSKFSQFGDIKACSVHIREHGDSYGFVTYVRPEDAALAVDRGHAIQGFETFDICFGGRRQFCKSDYADLGYPQPPELVLHLQNGTHDGKTVVREEFLPFCKARSSETVDFEELLSMARHDQQRSNK